MTYVCSGNGEDAYMGALPGEATPKLDFHVTIQVTNIQ